MYRVLCFSEPSLSPPMTAFQPADKNGLLLDLWTSQSSANARPCTQSPLWSSNPLQQSRYFLAPMARDPTFDYAVSLLPNDLLQNDVVLPKLTEENLKLSSYHHSGRSSFSELDDDVFSLQKSVPEAHSAQSSDSGHAKKHEHTRRKHKSTTNTQLYKTELCASYMKMGVCPYGGKCQFAHGNDELKQVSRPPKWRSKPCVNWAKYGACRYGNRCCFKHE